MTYHAKQATFTGGCLNFRMSDFKIAVVVASMASTCDETERRDPSRKHFAVPAQLISKSRDVWAVPTTAVLARNNIEPIFRKLES
jgi:hypothetical protein